MLKELLVAFGVVAVCVAIHTTGIVILAEWIVGWRARIERVPGMLHFAVLLILVFAVVVILHVAETGIWALFYYWWQLFDDYETSLYFSLSSYTTIGYGDVVLPQKWRLLSGIEGVSGVLLCGLSTAFLFVCVNAFYQIRMQQRSKL
jgi:hypothetical protein